MYIICYVQKYLTLYITRNLIIYILCKNCINKDIFIYSMCLYANMEIKAIDVKGEKLLLLGWQVNVGNMYKLI